MDTYDKYKNARDITWKFLIDNQLFQFPIDIQELLKRLDITTIERDLHERYAITFLVNDKYVIVYNPIECTKEQLRFTLAHELGHIILNHITNQLPNSYMENEANIFASRLLMPMIIIHSKKLFTAKDIASYFGVSAEAAKIRLERYIEIKDREKFLNSPLEKEYFELFSKANRFKL